MDCETFLLMHGYDTKSVGGKMFVFLLEEVLFMIDEGKSNYKIRQELDEIYWDYIHRFFRVKGKDFFVDVVDFLKNKNDRTNKNVPRVDDSLIMMARQIRSESKEKYGIKDKKVMVKRK